MSMNYKITKSKTIKDVVIIEPSVFTDKRGSIYTLFDKDLEKRLLPNGFKFNHQKINISKKNVLRGIHYDSKTWKLISLNLGSIYQVAVDLRVNSPTYLKFDSFKLNDKKHLFLLLPPGIGNAFYVYSKIAIYSYCLSYKGRYFDINDQKTISWNSPKLNIKWPSKKPILSSRDK